MKKTSVIIALFITILSLTVIVFGIRSLYFSPENNNDQSKINENNLANESLSETPDENKNSNDYEQNDEPEYNEQQSYSNLKTITYDELSNLIQDKKTFILLVSQTFCSHCHNYKPVLNETLKKHELSAYVIEYNLLSPEDTVAFDSIIPVTSTPTTIFIENGQENIDGRLEIETSQEVIEAHLKQVGYIK